MSPARARLNSVPEAPPTGTLDLRPWRLVNGLSLWQDGSLGPFLEPLLVLEVPGVENIGPAAEVASAGRLGPGGEATHAGEERALGQL